MFDAIRRAIRSASNAAAALREVAAATVEEGPMALVALLVWLLVGRPELDDDSFEV